MAIKIVSVKGENTREAVQKAKEALSGFLPKLILFFASSIYDVTDPAGEFQRAFPDCEMIGSTAHSEYFKDSFSNGTISVMAMDSASVADVCIRVIPNLRKLPAIAPVVSEMHDYFGGYDRIFDHFDRYIGIVLFESSAKSEEIIMDRLGTATDLLFVGGTSASADNDLSKVYANGKAYENAAVLAVLKTVNGYDVIKTQSAKLFSDRVLRVTKSDLPNRILYEFDGRPCGEVYAEVLGVPVDRISNYFVSNPLGVAAGEEIFIRTFNEVTADGITLHCGIAEGTEIHVLEIGDIVGDTRKALDRVITYQPAGVINFNCLYRTLEILDKHQVQPYCALFGRYNSIGFSTAGEAFLGHINETSTILVIK